jgi:hypothetical protein
MDLLFEVGDPNQPRGHALLYFRADDGRILATYLIVPPIAIEFGKYLPPLFTAHLPTLALPQNAAMPFPPLPEEVPGVDHLTRTAALRADDLLFGGHLRNPGPEELLQLTGEAVQRYAEYFEAGRSRAPELEPTPAALPEIDTEDLLLSLASDQERLSELSKRTGQLRYAVEGGDARAIEDAAQAMERVGVHLAAKYRVSDLIVAARRPGSRGQRLAELYLERAYKLAAEDFDGLASLDAAIAAESDRS